jgi:hypothetical protein
MAAIGDRQPSKTRTATLLCVATGNQQDKPSRLLSNGMSSAGDQSTISAADASCQRQYNITPGILYVISQPSPVNQLIHASRHQVMGSTMQHYMQSAAAINQQRPSRTGQLPFWLQQPTDRLLSNICVASMTIDQTTISTW